MNPINEIYLAGDPFTIGYEHGSLLRNTIQEFLADKFFRINSIRHVNIADKDILNSARQYMGIIEEDLPQIAEEIQGLAKGANISYEEASVLQIRREIIGQSPLYGGECSLLATIKASKGAIIAQTIDLNGEMANLGHVFHIKSSSEHIPEILMYSFAGLLGYVGLNSAGLAIGINFVLSDGWKPGVSPYLIVRHLLQLHTLEECLTELRRIRRSSSRSLTICDKYNLAIIEMTVDNLRVIPGSELNRTNHFLHPDFLKYDRMNIFSRNASVLRLDLINKLVKSINWRNAPEALFDLFSDHSLYPVGLCAHAEGNIRREDTVATVVLQPSSGNLFARKGHPCEEITQSFSLSKKNNLF